MLDRKTIGVEHRLLEELVGTWDAEASMVEAPGHAPVVIQAVSENQLILGGRFLEIRYTANGSNQLFRGLGLIGYDREAKCYQNFWIDDTSTRMAYIGRGQYDEARRRLTFSAKIERPDGAVVKLREVYSFTSSTRIGLEMFLDAGEGEYRSMQIRYSRPK